MSAPSPRSTPLPYHAATALLTGLTLLLCAACVQSTKMLTQRPADAPEFRYVGRVDTTDASRPVLAGAASYVEFLAGGDSLFVTLTAKAPSAGDHTFAAVEIAGEYRGRFYVPIGDTTFAFALPGGTTEAQHRIRVHHAAEALTSRLVFVSARAQTLAAAPAEGRELAVFFGDSMSSGAASDTTYRACGEGEYHDQTNAYLAFPARVGRALDMDYIVHSASGRGLYTNWNGQDPPLPALLPHLYLDTADATPYDMASADPVLAVVALGTNDLNSAPDLRPEFDSVTFRNAYRDLIDAIVQAHPRAAVLLSSSAMQSGPSARSFEGVLRRVVADARRRHPSLDIDATMLGDMELSGCPAGPHPSVEEHAVIAEQLLADARELLGRS